MSAWPTPDFLARERRPVVAWLVALSGIAALAASVVQGARLDAEFERQQQRMATTTLSASDRATVNGRRAASAPATAAIAAGDADAARAARRIAATLAHPWEGILTAVESATPDEVRWLSFEHAGDSGDVRLDGQAPDIAAALRTVDALAARTGWREVALVRLQSPVASAASAGAASPAGFRFAVEAKVDPNVLLRMTRGDAP